MSERTGAAPARWTLGLSSAVVLSLSSLSCQLSAPELPLRSQEVESSLSELNGGPAERAPRGAPLSLWQPLSGLAATAQSLLELRALSAAPLAARPPYPKGSQLCFALGSGAPPTIAWSGGRSPALSIPLPPRGVKALLLIMLDWDTPVRSQWRALNETYRALTLSPPELRRAPMTLWALAIDLGQLSELSRAQGALDRERLSIPRAYGGRGWPLTERRLARGAYHALNDYSDWFSHPPLKGPAQGYTGPCVPQRDPVPHHVSALALGLSRMPDLPAEGSPPLSAAALWRRAAPLVSALSRFDWSARLVHDLNEGDPPPLSP